MNIHEKYMKQLEAADHVISYQELQALSAYMKLDAEKTKAQLEHDAAMAKVEADKLRALYERKAELERQLEVMEETERKERNDIFKAVLGFVGTAATVALGVWRTQNSNKALDKMMIFEETGVWTTQSSRAMAKAYVDDMTRR